MPKIQTVELDGQARKTESPPLLPPLPDQIATSRLLLRPWSADDAPVLKALIDANLEHLRAWMPWAMNEPSPVEAIAKRIEMFRGQRERGEDFGVGVLLGDQAIGGAGLHRRDGPGVLEIGYWMATAHGGRGYATEAAAALTDLAFRMDGIERVEIRCDPRNVVSAAVPQKLGFVHTTTLNANTVTPTGEPRDTMVWEMTRSSWSATRDDPSMRALLRHMLATLAYRAAKACRGAPDGFTTFRAAPDSRSAGEILAHLGDLIEWVDSQARGAQRWHTSTPGAWDDDIARFHRALQHLDDHVASGAPLRHDAKRLFQGGLADSLTHVGQINMLRRLAGSPVRGENYAAASIAIGNVSPDQPPPRAEF